MLPHRTYTNSIRHVIVSEITIVIKCILYTVSEGKNVYVNGKLEHRSLLINSTELNNNFTVPPTIIIAPTKPTVAIAANGAPAINTNVYVDLQAILSYGYGGEALAFNQENDRYINGCNSN